MHMQDAIQLKIEKLMARELKFTEIEGENSWKLIQTVNQARKSVIFMF